MWGRRVVIEMMRTYLGEIILESSAKPRKENEKVGSAGANKNRKMWTDMGGEWHYFDVELGERYRVR